MTLSVLINNYNYRPYVGAAIGSVLAQTRPADEIIVVDDGSTDGSGEVIRSYADRHPRLRFIDKPNGGQLSSINAAFTAASGDLLFFLDSDDEYLPDYLENAAADYESHPGNGFLFCAHERFGHAQGIVRNYSQDCDLGLTVALSRCYSAMVTGSVTSTLSMRRAVAARFLPLPAWAEDDWRVRADDCLVWGASLAGAGKRYLNLPLVRYRVHGGNRHFGRAFSARYDYDRSLRTDRLMRHFDRTLDLPADLTGFCVPEFLCKPRPRALETRVYMHVIWGFEHWSLRRRARMVWAVFRHFLATRRAPEISAGG